MALLINQITTPLVCSSHPRVQLNLRWRDITKQGEEALTALYGAVIQKQITQAGIPLDQVAQIRKDGFFSADGRRLAEMEAADWDAIRTALIASRAKAPKISDPAFANQPEPPIERAGRARVTFQNIAAPHYLDGISYSRIERNPGESEANYFRRIARLQAKGAYDPGTRGTRESINGVAQSCVPRQNYEMTIALEGQMQQFFNGREEPFISREILAKNGFVPGAVISSFHRYADRTSLLRAVTAEDGSVDLVSGRAFDLESAEEIARFSFLSQMNLYRDEATRHLAQGIAQEGDQLVFEFAVQSLLPVGPFGGKEAEMVRASMRAYQELGESGPLLIKDPANPAVVYKVKFRPYPVACCQYNSSITSQRILPAAISGEVEARAASKISDEDVFAKADEVLANPALLARHANRMGFSEDYYRRAVADTRHFLEEQNKFHFLDTPLTATGELMCRAFLWQLLGIHMIDNCKSVVDRTNVANATITAMKQWLRSGKEIPEKEGRIAIFDLPQVEDVDSAGRRYHPFRELFAFNFHKGVKITELSRGVKGYKIGQGWLQHPAIKELLPKRYLKTKEISRGLYFYRRWVLPILSWFLTPFLMQILHTLGSSAKERKMIWLGHTALWNQGFKGKVKAIAISFFSLILPIQQLAYVCMLVYTLFCKTRYFPTAIFAPLKMVFNADAFVPRVLVNENYRRSGARQLLFQGLELGPIELEA